VAALGPMLWDLMRAEGVGGNWVLWVGVGCGGLLVAIIVVAVLVMRKKNGGRHYKEIPSRQDGYVE